MNLKNEIEKYFRIDGTYILRDFNRVFKIDFIDTDGDIDSKYYIIRFAKNGKYKKVTKENIIDFTVLNFNNNGEYTYTIYSALPSDVKLFKTISFDEHIDDFK